MNGPSPDQRRRILAAYKLVGKYWYTDFSTKELRRKPLKGLSKILNLFWKTRHTVKEFYWWLSYRRAEEDMIMFPNPIHSDNMPIPDFPIKYELQGGWTIPRGDLKYLIKGPLVSEGLTEILVPAALGYQRLWLFVRQFAPVIGAIISFAGALIRWWPELMAIYALRF